MKNNNRIIEKEICGADAALINSLIASIGYKFFRKFYVGPEMESPRYHHTATNLQQGQILIVGGSDERHLTSLDNAELFDQGLAANPPPESIV